MVCRTVTASEALHLILCCKFTENYRIPFRLRWEYGTVPVAFLTTDTVPYLQTLRCLNYVYNSFEMHIYAGCASYAVFSV